MRPNYPHDWTSQTLEQLCFQVTSGGTPTSGSRRYYVEFGGLPFAKTEDLTRARTKFIDDCELAISDAALKESAAKRYPAGTIFVSMYGTIGLTKIAAVEMAGNQALCALVPPFACNSDYLHHHLEYIRPHWLKHSGQTTQANINGATVRAHEVPLPSFSEQRAIAQILDTLDTAIHETEAIIAKLKAVKQGLLHDLLTRGIDDNGELRPPQSETPHLYKPSPLGWIPKEWEQAYLGAKVEFFGGYAFPERCQGQSEGEVPFFKVSDQSNPGNERDLRVANNYVSRELARKQGWKLLPEGGVAFAKVGAALLMNRRRLLAQDSLVDNNMMVATGGDEVHSTWLYWFLQTIDFGKIVQDGALPSVNQGQLGALPASFPKLEEQREIADRLNRLDGILDMEQICLEKSRQLKTALMDDLLTGRVRVTPLLQEAQHA
ncbi:restriction endonuclease subunit S [Pseudoxanthomonas taiwanensis]|nr:restriction endonuclease subunit S [Pseudoxanthomonas taiwanensis]